jgi:uncharacterized membrane protein (DUF485 family)
MIHKKALEISKNPKFQQLVKTRSGYSWFLTFVMMFMYFGFICLVAFNKDFLARPIGSGVTTLSIPIGIGMILFTIILTGLYVRRANTEFDDLTQEILKETK